MSTSGLNAQASQSQSQQTQSIFGPSAQASSSEDSVTDDLVTTGATILSHFAKEIEANSSMTSSVSLSNTSFESLVGRKFYRDAPKR